MSKRQFKSQASSGRAGGGFGAFGGAGFGSTQSSVLSYVQEPPDYSSISDANLVVAFKNLSKKDTTTKARALEDLQAALISTDSEVEDAVVEAWVKLFPRLSIDNARRVRQLAQTLNGQICARCGKRVAKHLARISGPWLAGSFDLDRAAAKAAQDALTAVFPSPDKVLGLKKAFHESILDYCKAAMLNETVQTLSDERAISTEDAEAIYARVVSTSVSVITSLLEIFSHEDIAKQNGVYNSILGDNKFWDFAYHKDASVRRVMHRLVQTCINEQPHLVEPNLEAASRAYVYKGLPSDQTSSAADFAQTLHALTSKYPTIWTAKYHGKRSAISRFQQCLKNGSHSGTAAFWDAIREIIRQIPEEILPKRYDDATDLLFAARDGVSKREERLNAASAWPTYFTLVDTVSLPFSEDDTKILLEAFVAPPMNQYLNPSEDSAKWSITGANAASLVANVALVARIPPLIESKWPYLAEKLIDVAKSSQPESSKDFDKSQKHVVSSGERWAALQRELYDKKYNLSGSILSAFATANVHILKGCVALLQSRNGKPYGAAAIIEEIVRTCSPYLMQEQGFRPVLTDFVLNQVPTLMFTPSQKYLVRCLYAAHTEPEFEKAFMSTLHGVLDAQEPNDAKAQALLSMFPPNTPKKAIELARSSSGLQSFLITKFLSSGQSTDKEFFADLLKLGVISQDTSDELLSKLTASLSLENQALEAILATFQHLTASNQLVVKDFMARESGQELLPNILRLEQSTNDTISEKASAISAQLSSAMGNAATSAKYGVILQSLEQVSSLSLPIDTMLDLTNKIMAEHENNTNAKDMFPNLQIWQNSIIASMKPPEASLSILSPLGGAVHLVHRDTEAIADPVQYDAEGFSQALRIAMYLARLFKTSGFVQEFAEENFQALALLSICALLAEDNISVTGANSLWIPTDTDSLEVEVVDFISEANQILRQYRENVSPGSAEVESIPFFTSFEALRRQDKGDSPMAYYAALAAAKACDDFFELHGHSSEQARAAHDMLRVRKAAKDALALISFIIGFAQPLMGSQAITRLCNELVADLTDTKFGAHDQNTFEQLTVLNAILRTQDDIAEQIQKTRLIFFFKHLVLWLQAQGSIRLKTEICKVLTSLMPTLSDLYGEHWNQIMEFIVTAWTSTANSTEESTTPSPRTILNHATLKLYGTLRKFTKVEDPNDDLVDAFKDTMEDLNKSLIMLLKLADGTPDEHHQPLMVTNELLAREVSQVPLERATDAEELFQLLYTPSHAIQGAAFNLLHRKIPAAQEQISFDAALDNKVALLPDELLSLVIQAPTLDSLATASFERTMPSDLQGFLYSWRLVFDHFVGSSYRVKSDYVDQLKGGDYLTGLLALIFDLLGHTRGRPIDASRFDIVNYFGDSDPDPEKDVQWLLTHLYYLALFNLPSLVKTYFLEIRSRQTIQAIESWTAKHIAPIIVGDTLQSVEQWAQKSVRDDPEYENMTVKVSLGGKEINASYLVDEQTMAIKVILPETYPLNSAKVIGVNRVAVKEDQWQSWLWNCQGVIMFSNGSIIDGLSAWRKNVFGALKGQTECAICYSIISGDKQLPTKRCPTCKNMFHSSCLLKWFKTSNASTCPLCRNPFNFN